MNYKPFAIRSWWREGEFLRNWPDLKPFNDRRDSHIGFGNQFQIPDPLIVTSNNRYKILKGKYFNSVGKLTQVNQKDYHTLNVNLEFKCGSTLKITHKNLLLTNEDLTNLELYKKPNYIINHLGQELNIEDTVLIPRHNQIYFAKIKQIRSQKSFTADLLYPRTNKKEITVYKLDGVIKWERNSDFDEMAAILILKGE